MSDSNKPREYWACDGYLYKPGWDKWADSYPEEMRLHLIEYDAYRRVEARLMVEEGISEKLEEALAACMPSWLPPEVRDLRRQALTKYQNKKLRDLGEIK